MNPVKFSLKDGKDDSELMRPGSLVSIDPHFSFLDTVARIWCERAGDSPEALGRGTILLPGRRAARALSEAFLRQRNGQPMLLPDIRAIGAPDEAELALRGAETLLLPPSVPPLRRLAVLTCLVLRAEKAFGTRPTLDQAWPLAGALADLMDEAERSGIDLAGVLPKVVDRQFAEHWHITLDFLKIVTQVWPEWLAEQGVMNPAARQSALLRAQGEHLASVDAGAPLWAVGFTDALPATVSVLRGVMAHPQGSIILPGLDFSVEKESFKCLPEGHPQAGLARLLKDLGATRDDVEQWDTGVQVGVPDTRAAFLGRVLCPAGDLASWVENREHVVTDGVFRMTASDQQEEAAAIALILRDAIEVPERRAALVTPDRALAARVAVELARWGITADDSAGLPLLIAPAAILLRLLAQAVDGGLDPVTLLSLLKHPLVSCGFPPGVCRATARLLERKFLRGPAPEAGIIALRRHVLAQIQDQTEGLDEVSDPARQADLPDQPCQIMDFLDRLQECLAPLDACRSADRPLPDLLQALLESAELLASTHEENGASRLWRGEDGEALAGTLSELIASTDVLPEQPVTVLDGLLVAVLAEQRVTLTRAAPGSPARALHPRVFIWGLTEARLQGVECVVLGGLVEGVWPPATDPGPWLSRPMREAAGLPSPERAIGQAAHDFVSTVCMAPEVILSCPGRREGAPAVPARWLVRMDAFLDGRGQKLRQHPAPEWLKRIDRPAFGVMPVHAPEPRPPVAQRPRRLSVTEIETWIRDPYAIYARHVLKLRALPELAEAADASDYGMIVHDALETWFREHGTSWPANAAESLRSVFLHTLDKHGLRPALKAWWRPRLLRIADFVAEAESAYREERGIPQTILTEMQGRATFTDLPGGDFHLTGRADRIDCGSDGQLTVFDYKTGQVPSQKAVLAGWNPQLPLEAAMARRGAFRKILHEDGTDLEISALVYWYLNGGSTPGQVKQIVSKNETVTDVAETQWQSLRERIEAYDQEEQPYLSHPHPGQEPRFSDYALLARVAEWSLAREEGGE